ncbi:ribonuclease H-like domain-containing protein [Tanacetum coccineum]|uniref:Ribonuclease H-like domain-containing protein n=1 Tax=Tanacetum coccineum TaxID=301880 RepID=A0ABQ5AJF1_9ASTR
MGYFQIIRADGSSRRYSSMIRMLHNIDRENLETLWKLVKAKHGNTRPDEAYERVNLQEELFTHKEEMDLETAQTTTTTKLPILKQKNGNSFKPEAQTTTNADGTSTSLIPGLVTIEEKAQKKNDVKTLFAAIQTRFGGNDATKKTRKTLLKQMYETFSALSTESLESIFNKLQKIVSQLAILGENISQEDLNLKFLRSVPSEWNTHVVVKGTASSSSSSSSQNMAFVSSPSSTNEVNNAYGVSTANTQVSPASTQVSTASTQVSTANLKDDIEEMDLKWQLALLNMRTRRFFQKTGRKITINGSDTAGYDKSKVECFNCHKMGHFARECRGPRNQDSKNRNQDNSRKTVHVEETSSKAMVAIYGAGFDWSYMADDEVPTNMALMAFSDSEVHNDKTCSKTYLKSFETLKTQLDDLRIEFNKFEFNLATYKRGLASVEEQLVFYKKNEVIFCEQLVVLKRDISYKDSELSMLKSELEKLKQEKESNQLKIKKFDNASKSLDKLIGSRIPDKSRKGLGFLSYNDVPPPPTRLFSPPNLDLSNSGLEEFQQPEFEGYEPKTSKNVSEDTSNEVRESPDAPMVEKLVSDDKLEKKTVFPTVAKIEFVRPKQQEKPIRKPVKYAEMYRSQSPKGNQRNWNNYKSQQLGSNFVMYNKVCFVCGSFVMYHQRKRVESRNNYTRVNYNYSAKKTHPSAHRNMVPRAVLMKTSLKAINTARPVITAHPKTTVYSARPMSHYSKLAQSTVKRPYHIRTALTNKNFSQKVNTAKGKFYTTGPKYNNP